MEPLTITETHLFFYDLATLRNSVCVTVADAAIDGRRRKKLQKIREVECVPPMDGAPILSSTQLNGKTLKNSIVESESAILEATAKLYPDWSPYQLARFLGIQEYKVRRIREAYKKLVGSEQ